MTETQYLDTRLHALSSLLISADADLTVHNSEGFAACSLIFKSQHGLPYLETFVYQHIDIYLIQELTSVDAWVLAALARSLPDFQQRMESQFAEYRTPKCLSPSRNRFEHSIPQFEVERQISEVKEASVLVRTGFLRALCAKGTIEMIRLFLGCGVDLNEVESPEPKTYIRAAALQGNIEVVLALLDAGASVDIDTSYPEYGEWEPPAYRARSPVDDFLARWHSLREQGLEFIGKAEEEHWVLKTLLLHPTFNQPNVLFWAFWTASPPAVIKDLLDAGCGRRDNTAPASWCQKVNGSEVIEAVKLNIPIIPLLLEYGLAKECEDCFGFTALLHSLDGGQASLDSAKVLINAGVDLLRPTKSGLTPLRLVQKNLNAQHPRWAIASRTPLNRTGKQELDKSRFKPVSLEEDQRAYNLYIHAVGSCDRIGYWHLLQSKSHANHSVVSVDSCNIKTIRVRD